MHTYIKLGWWGLNLLVSLTNSKLKIQLSDKVVVLTELNKNANIGFLCAVLRVMSYSFANILSASKVSL